jgi:hypothetical protein
MIYVNINNIFIIQLQLCWGDFEGNYPHFSQFKVQRALQTNNSKDVKLDISVVLHIQICTIYIRKLFDIEEAKTQNVYT